jgi:predicted HTH transcriptional regulator
MAAPTLTQDKVEELLKYGEDEHTEFKLKMPNPLIIAKSIGAFANSDGGVIIIGAGENGEVRSADFLAVQKVIGNALDFIFPKPEVSTEEFQLHGASIAVIEVQPSPNKPILVDGKILIRSGSEDRTADSSDVRRLVEPENSSTKEPSIDDLRNELRHLSDVISIQNQIIVNSNSFKNKLPDWIIGGVIGAVIAMLIAAMIGF